MGPDPIGSLAIIETLDLNGQDGQWLRFRRMGHAPVIDANMAASTGIPTEVVVMREALHRIRERGFYPVAILEWPPSYWLEGTRAGSQSNLPIDLTEAFSRCRDLARTYGDLIEAWEIDNEPDISFTPENAETFGAFYKACALGIIAGREDNKRILTQRRGVAESAKPESAASAIMHAPLALPPGPYWDELVANDTLSYTEAFNYHYYGYAEDFRGVRDAWVTALDETLSVRREEENAAPGNAELQLGPTSPLSGASCASPDLERLDFRPLDLKTWSKTPALPLFLTEYGYGLLDRFDRHTVDGRQRQADWYRHVLPHLTDGTITGAMAFVFMPYYERGVNEFGLLAEAEPQLISESLKVEGLNVAEANLPPYQDAISQSSPFAQISLPVPRPSDFRHLDPTGLSPVVIDFIAGEDTQSVKRYNGHLLHAKADTDRSGRFQLVLYNFNDEPATGSLQITLEDGKVTRYASPDAKRPKGAIETPKATAETETTDNDLRPSALRPSTTAAAVQPQPYVRPPTPRPSGRPITESNWPTPNTTRFTTPNGKTYAISPALELLRAAARSAGPSPGTPSSSSAPSGNKSSALSSESLETLSGQRSDISSDLKTFRPLDLKTELKLAELQLPPHSRTVIELAATLPGTTFTGHRLTATWHAEDEAVSHQQSGTSPTQPNTEGASLSSDLSVKTLATAGVLQDGTTEQHSDSPLDDLKTFRPLDFKTESGENRAPHSILSTLLYPEPSSLREQTLDTFTFDAAANLTNRKSLLNRPRATEEAVTIEQGRWLVTPGTTVEETLFGWRITINDLPENPLRPAEVELPFPDVWTFPSDALLRFEYRLVPISPTIVSSSEPDSTLRPLDSGPSDRNLSRSNRFEEFDINFRDVHGALWSVWPRLFAKAEVQTYLELGQNFTPMFFSRPPTNCSSVLPSNRLPSTGLNALVIMLRPRTLPTTIEINFPRIITLK